ncbi:MAG: NRDE family protein [Pseudomonadota bacterium]
MNRDERRTRPAGEEPSYWPNEDILAPRDPEAGGTWIGVRRDGVWACLLNGYNDRDRVWPATVAAQTRGRLVPLILASDSPQAVLPDIDLSATMGFRVWMSVDDRVLEYSWDGTSLKTRSLDAESSLMTTSSSVRQDEVTRLRQGVFAEWTRQGGELHTNGIPTFHLDPLGLDREDAVLMARDFSHTKSCTQIIVEPASITMKHWPLETMTTETTVGVAFPSG